MNLVPSGKHRNFLVTLACAPGLRARHPRSWTGPAIKGTGRRTDGDAKNSGDGGGCFALAFFSREIRKERGASRLFLPRSLGRSKLSACIITNDLFLCESRTRNLAGGVSPKMRWCRPLFGRPTRKTRVVGTRSARPTR